MMKGDKMKTAKIIFMLLNEIMMGPGMVFIIAFFIAASVKVFQESQIEKPVSDSEIKLSCDKLMRDGGSSDG